MPDPKYKSTEWMATCPRCAMNVSQDYYPCNNCGYRPLTFEFTPKATFGTYPDRDWRAFSCVNCNHSYTPITCPNTNCGTSLAGVVYSTKLSKYHSPGRRNAELVVYALGALVVLIVLAGLLL